MVFSLGFSQSQSNFKLHKTTKGNGSASIHQVPYSGKEMCSFPHNLNSPRARALPCTSTFLGSCGTRQPLPAAERPGLQGPLFLISGAFLCVGCGLCSPGTVMYTYLSMSPGNGSGGPSPLGRQQLLAWAESFTSHSLDTEGRWGRSLEPGPQTCMNTLSLPDRHFRKDRTLPTVPVHSATLMQGLRRRLGSSQACPVCLVSLPFLSQLPCWPLHPKASGGDSSFYHSAV